MVDYQNDRLYFTPYYYVLKQFSRSMRPGDTVLGIKTQTANQSLHVCAVSKPDGSIAVNILNTGAAVTFPLQIGEYIADIAMPANCVETIIVKL